MRATIAIAVLMGIAVFAARAAEAPTEPAATATESRAVMTGDQVVQILDETVDWYRTLGTQQQAATQPSDLLILYANRQTADKVMKLAFEIARANAELLSSEAGVKQAAEEAASEQSLSRLRKQLDDQRASIQAEIEASKRELASATEAGSGDTCSRRISVLQGQLDLLNARRNMLGNMAQFANETDATGFGANALKAHIDAIAASIPAASGTQASVAATSAGCGLDDVRIDWRRCWQLAQPVRDLGPGGHGVSAFRQGAHDRADRSADGRAAADVQHHSHAAARAAEASRGSR